MQNNDSILDIINLPTKEIITRLIMLGEDIDSHNYQREFYQDLYQKCLTSDPANLQIIRRYEANKKDLTDSVLSKKRPREDDDHNVDSITKMKNFCETKRFYTSSEKKYRAMVSNDLPILNYPSINMKIQQYDDIILEVDNSTSNIEPASKVRFERSKSDTWANNEPNRVSNLGTPIHYNRSSSSEIRKFERPKSPSPIRSVKRSANKGCICVNEKPKKIKTVKTSNAKNLIALSGVMGLSGVSYIIYKRREELADFLTKNINNIIDIIEKNPINCIIVFGFIV